MGGGEWGGLSPEAKDVLEEWLDPSANVDIMGNLDGVQEFSAEQAKGIFQKRLEQRLERGGEVDYRRAIGELEAVMAKIGEKTAASRAAAGGLVPEASLVLEPSQVQDAREVLLVKEGVLMDSARRSEVGAGWGGATVAGPRLTPSEVAAAQIPGDLVKALLTRLNLQGQREFESGEYRQALAYFQYGESLLPVAAMESTVLGGEITLWKGFSLEAMGRREEAMAVMDALASAHPRPAIRQQAAGVLRIWKAPQLRIRREEMADIPDLSSIPDRKGRAPWSDSGSTRPPPRRPMSKTIDERYTFRPMRLSLDSPFVIAFGAYSLMVACFLAYNLANAGKY